MPTRQQSDEERQWQDHKAHWLARDVYRVERGMGVVGLVLGLPAALGGAILLGWLVVAMTDYLMR